MIRFLILPLFAVLAGCATSHPNLPTQPAVDLRKYAGTWYEQARLPNDFQKACVGEVRADYVLQADQTIGVTNQCVTADGGTKVAKAEGRLSTTVSPQDPAKLEVRFAPAWTSWLPMVWGDYWILRLAGDYQYSLVGTPDRRYLWVLSRERQGDPQMIRSLLDYAGTLGFPIDQIAQSGQ